MTETRKFRFKKIFDDPCVKVNGDLERAIRKLRHRVNASKHFKILKARRAHPAPADRRRQKRKNTIKRIELKIKRPEKYDPK